jgi:hypothetical protein
MKQQTNEAQTMKHRQSLNHNHSMRPVHKIGRPLGGFALSSGGGNPSDYAAHFFDSPSEEFGDLAELGDSVDANTNPDFGRISTQPRLMVTPLRLLVEPLRPKVEQF